MPHLHEKLFLAPRRYAKAVDDASTKHLENAKTKENKAKNERRKRERDAKVCMHVGVGYGTYWKEEEKKQE